MKYYIIFLISVFISSISQIILKKSAKITYKNWWKEYLNLYVIVAYMIFVLSTFITMYAYKEVPLSFGPILEATGYIYVTIMSALFLKERVSKRKYIGVAIIILGIICSNF